MKVGLSSSQILGTKPVLALLLAMIFSPSSPTAELCYDLKMLKKNKKSWDGIDLLWSVLKTFNSNFVLKTHDFSFLYGKK